MRRIIATVAAVMAFTTAVPGTQDAPQPTFRAGVDVIQLDVTVLDKNRRPVRGLAAADFIVLENGKPQRIIAVSAVDAATGPPVPSAWMRQATRDVSTNDLTDELGDGGVFAIVIDDSTLPYDSTEIEISTRGIAHHVVDQLGPADRGAVVYTFDSGRSQDFTDDAAALDRAIESFDPRPHSFDRNLLDPPSSRERGNSNAGYAILGPECFRQTPAVPALDALVTRLANIPRRRKTLFFLSTFGPSNLKGGRGCAGVISEAMKEILAKAQRGNVNFYPVDPSGRTGYEDYLRDQAMRGGRRGIQIGPAGGRSGSQGGSASGSAGGRATPIRAPGSDQRPRRETLQIMADYTGGRAILGTDLIKDAVDQIFDEDTSYYLVGYQTANTKPDGAFRRVEVKVNRPGIAAHTQSGYWAPGKDRPVAEHLEAALAADIGVSTWTTSGLSRPTGLFLRANVVPVAKAGATGRDVEVAVVLTTRLPPLTRPATETVSVVRSVYDSDGRAAPPSEQRTTLSLVPPAGGDVSYDLISRLTLAPGRYQIGFRVHSTLADKNGSVLVDVEVPDFGRPPLSISGLALGVQALDAAPRRDVLERLLPFAPTTRREFAPGERVVGFLRVFQGDGSVPSPAVVRTQMVDASNGVRWDRTATLPAEAFAMDRVVDHLFDVPLEGLSHGPHLLTVSVAMSEGQSQRQDLVIRVR